jgi:hypothetical protein
MSSVPVDLVSLRRMAFSGMLRRVALVRTDVSEESPILVTLMMEALSSSEMSVFTRATRRDAILHSHRRENLKSYLVPLQPKKKS